MSHLAIVQPGNSFQVDIDAVTEQAMLVYCNIRAWHGRKTDKDLQREMASLRGAAQARLYAGKKLCECKELDRIKTLDGQIRSIFYSFTSPWNDEGGRVMAATAYPDAVAKLNPLINEREVAVQDFLYVYPQIVENDKQAFNSAWKSKDYPHPSIMAARFSVKVAFGPLPKEEDFRVKLKANDLKEIKEDLKSSYNRAHELLMKDLLSRLVGTDKAPGPIRHMAESLVVPDKVFRDSLVYNVVELVEFLPKLNYTNNPEISQLLREISEKLCSTTPETLRENEAVRELVAEEAAELVDDIEAKMSGYF